MRKIFAPLFSLFFLFANCAATKQDSSILVLELKGEVNEDSVTPIINKLQETQSDDSVKEVVLIIDTFGGSVIDGEQLASAMESYPKNVKCLVDNTALSMGAYLLESRGCKERYATKHSLVMFHEAAGQVAGNSHEMRKEAQLLDKIDQLMVYVVSERLGMKEEEFKSKIYNQMWWLDYKEMLLYHVIDGIRNRSDFPPPTQLEHAAQSVIIL